METKKLYARDHKKLEYGFVIHAGYRLLTHALDIAYGVLRPGGKKVKKFDVTDYRKLTKKLIDLDDGGVYVFRLPIGASVTQMVEEWKGIENKPNCKIMFITHGIEVYKKK